MELVVTPGETKLIAALAELKQPIVTEPLLIGDIHIRTVDGHVLYIFERKAGNDLDASIKDGRYHEQKDRLKQCKCKIIYILENMPAPAIHTDRIWSAICNTMNRDSCQVFTTRSVKDTANYLCAMLNSTIKYPPLVDLQVTAASVKIKKPVVKPADFYKNILILIPGVSDETAQLIIDNHSTLAELASFIKTTNAAKIISDYKRSKSNRRLGIKLADCIVEYISELNF